MNLYTKVLLCLFLLYACGNAEQPTSKKTPVNPFESALPHTESLPFTELSGLDKIKLAQANGREAIDISIDSLQELMNRDTNQLFIYAFWNLDCISCIRINDFLREYQFKDRITPRYELVLVNTDNLYPENINAHIREKGIITPVYNLQVDTIPQWHDQIESNWTGQLPGLLILNQKEGLRLFYQQTFTAEELEAVIYPLTL